MDDLYCVLYDDGRLIGVEKIGTRKFCDFYLSQRFKRNIMLCKLVPVKAWDGDGNLVEIKEGGDKYGC